MNKEVAKEIRKALNVFNGVKFSVTCRRGGDSVTIRYQDGPTSESVNKLVNCFELGHFNGMNDCYEYSNRRDDIPQCRYVFVTREYSDTAISSAIASVRAEYGIQETYTADDYHSGKLMNVSAIENARGEQHWSVQSVISRTLSQTAF